MTSERHLYRHVETGIESVITDRVAAVFGDRLVRVEEPAVEESPKPTRSRKKADETDSSKGENE